MNKKKKDEDVLSELQINIFVENVLLFKKYEIEKIEGIW